MRRENAIFFVSGLIFGVLVGYFVFQSVIQAPGTASAGINATSSRVPTQEQPGLDHEEVARLEAVAEQNPEDAEIRAQIGAIYMQGNHLQEAVRWLGESIEIDDGNLEVRNHLAISLTGLGRVDEAVSEYRSALAVEPSHPASLLGLGRVLLLGKNDIRGGIEVWEKLIEAAPDSPEARSIREELEALSSAHQ